MLGMEKIAIRRQRGVSLFIVLIILLLSLIVVLSGLTVANLNESLVGNQSDAQRAYGAAEALLNAAQRDIRLNGRFCNAAALGGGGTNPTILSGTPATAAACTLRYPSDGNWSSDYTALAGFIGGNNHCGTGNFISICISSDPANSQFQITKLDTGVVQVWSNGADYNNSFINRLDNNGRNGMDYGGSAVAGSGVAAAVSLALTAPGAGQNSNGKYWVEIFPYNVNATALNGVPASVPVPDGTYPFVFRITVKAKGLKNGTVSVLRTYYVPYPMRAVNAVSGRDRDNTPLPSGK